MPAIDLTTILALILGIIVIGGAVVYLIGILFQQLLARDLQNYQANLQAELERSRAQMQLDFQARLLQYQARFSPYHQKRAEVISELYARLGDAVATLAELFNSTQFTERQPRQEERQRSAAADALNDLLHYYRTHRLYLDQTVWEQLDPFLGKLLDAFHTYQQSQQLLASGEVPTDLGQQAGASIQDGLSAVRRSLEHLLRQTLSADLTESQR